MRTLKHAGAHLDEVVQLGREWAAFQEAKSRYYLSMLDFGGEVRGPRLTEEDAEKAGRGKAHDRQLDPRLLTMFCCAPWTTGDGRVRLL